VGIGTCGWYYAADGAMERSCMTSRWRVLRVQADDRVEVNRPAPLELGHLGIGDPDLAGGAHPPARARPACASGHNFQPIRTIYRWQSQVHDKTEGRVVLRTRRSLLPRIIDRVKREHPYEVPSIVAVPIIDGSPDYLRWILEETEQPA
jgi:periplasmic divalent cation tolerance protein